jgi:hypothetical protein
VQLYLHSPNTPPWRGVQLRTSTGTTLPFTFTLLSDTLSLCSSHSAKGRASKLHKTSWSCPRVTSYS